MTRSREWIGATLAVIALGCARQAAVGSPPAVTPALPPPGEPTACAEVARTPLAAVTSLAGVYRLTLVATSGARAGTRETGDLTLRAFTGADGEARRAQLYGSTSVSPAAVGGEAPGPVLSMDPAKPGVLVLEWLRDSAGATIREITVRLGADANGSGPPRFDGASMVLSVGAVERARFTGRWASEAGTMRAGGYFCAVSNGR